MFGFNCGVLCSGQEFIRLLQRRGAPLYAAPTARVIGIVVDYMQEGLWGENDVASVPVEITPYSPAVAPPQISSEPQVTYSPAVLSEQTMPRFIQNEVSAPDVAPTVPTACATAPQAAVVAPTACATTPLVTPVVTVAPVTTIAPIAPVVPVEPLIQVSPVAPDISGMTLKGQAQAIAVWTDGKRTLEENLVTAFGKSIVQKLIGEGYLVRTKKGILIGS
ncbi:hypothetical protein FACS1894208_00820 [Clostridia bacterium]|nr:hypothetical protein FACS1894208_00820 [Clostridia bacterium]